MRVWQARHALFRAFPRHVGVAATRQAFARQPDSVCWRGCSRTWGAAAIRAQSRGSSGGRQCRRFTEPPFDADGVLGVWAPGAPSRALDWTGFLPPWYCELKGAVFQPDWRRGGSDDGVRQDLGGPKRTAPGARGRSAVGVLCELAPRRTSTGGASRGSRCSWAAACQKPRWPSASRTSPGLVGGERWRCEHRCTKTEQLLTG